MYSLGMMIIDILLFENLTSCYTKYNVLQDRIGMLIDSLEEKGFSRSIQMVLGYMLHPNPEQRLSFKELFMFINDEYFKDDELREKFEDFIDKKQARKNGIDPNANAVDEDFMNKMNDTIRKALKTNEQQPVKVYSLPKSKVTTDNEFIGRY